MVPGNNGLKDQAAAIQWVSDNIAAFGGDRDRITVAGQDTGAVSAHLHMFSPLSKGKRFLIEFIGRLFKTRSFPDLINSVISQSGSAFAPSSISYPGEALAKAKKLAETNACPVSTNTEMVTCLRKLDVEQITTSDAMLYVSIYLISKMVNECPRYLFVFSDRFGTVSRRYRSEQWSRAPSRVLSSPNTLKTRLITVNRQTFR